MSYAPKNIGINMNNSLSRKDKTEVKKLTNKLVKYLEDEFCNYDEIIGPLIEVCEKIENKSLRIFYDIQTAVLNGTISQKKLDIAILEYNMMVKKNKEEIDRCKEEIEHLFKDIRELRTQTWHTIIRSLANDKSSLMLACSELNKFKITIDISYSMYKETIDNYNLKEYMDMLKQALEDAQKVLKNKETEPLINTTYLIPSVDTSPEDNEKMYSTNSLKYKELISIAIKEGFDMCRQHGSHLIFKNEKNRVVVIPNKTGTAPRGLQATILKSIFIN